MVKTPTQEAAQTPEKKLKSLLSTTRSVKRNIQSAAGELGETIKDAVENHHLHRRAFRAVVAEDKMEPDELNEYYSALEYYRDVAGLTERAKSAPRLELAVDNTDKGRRRKKDDEAQQAAE